MGSTATATWPTGRRIKAAMRLAGIDSFEELAERIGQRNYGARTLRKYADDSDSENIARRPQLMLIAEACELPYEFFTADFGALAQPQDDALTQRLTELEAQQAEDSIRLAQLEEAVQTLAATDHQPQDMEAGQR